jgi:CDP-2,3-bis-(O-geranylgeranyl)-sn-glycerol synthase
MPHPEPLACALFLVVAMSLAGVAHAWWLRSPLSQRFNVPIDGGRALGGKPVFGANKAWRGFMVLPPACAASFGLAGLIRAQLPDWLARGIWDLSPPALATLGFACGLAFMLAELPNSFLKRRLGVAPGMAPRQPWLAATCLAVDRLDSVVGVLLLLTVTVGMTPQTWLWVLALGAGMHWLFSAWLYRLRVKARPL